MHPAPIPFVPSTKLRPPRFPDDILWRARLAARLDRRDALTLIVASAGCGKTTLVGSWLAHRGRPHAWLSLEHEDNTLPVFLAGFVAALRRLFPTCGAELLALLQNPTVKLTPELVLPILLNELDTLGEDFVLVLDDYHHIRDPAIHALLWGLLIHPPRPLQLVLTARCDPPIPPRIRCRCTEIRARELCFTEQETDEFLAQFTAQPPTAQSIAALVAQAEGWAVPLRLVAILLGRRQDALACEVALRTCERSLLDYLDAEVIGQLPAEIQAFLAYTSLLPQLTGPLCDALIGGAIPGVDGAATLSKLAQAGIFTEYLDDDGCWFRYHELFRTLLQRRLRSTHDQQEIVALEERARAWCEQHDLPAASWAHALCREVTPDAALTAASQAAKPVAAARDAAMLAAATPMPTHIPAQPGRNLRGAVTFREMDVLRLLRQRMTNKEIAHELCISSDTVRQHASNLYRKLGVENRRQAVVQASTLGVLDKVWPSRKVQPQRGSP